MISRELVSLHKQFYGKGPVKAKTFLVDDTVLCMLEGGFTRRRADADRGRRGRQRCTRSAPASRLRWAIGSPRSSSGRWVRKVRAYMSHVHTDPDVAAELFMLEPLDEPLLEAHHYHPDEPDG